MQPTTTSHRKPQAHQPEKTTEAALDFFGSPISYDGQDFFYAEKITALLASLQKMQPPHPDYNLAFIIQVFALLHNYQQHNNPNGFKLINQVLIALADNPRAWQAFLKFKQFQKTNPQLFISHTSEHAPIYHTYTLENTTIIDWEKYLSQNLELQKIYLEKLTKQKLGETDQIIRGRLSPNYSLTLINKRRGFTKSPSIYAIIGLVMAHKNNNNFAAQAAPKLIQANLARREKLAIAEIMPEAAIQIFKGRSFLGRLKSLFGKAVYPTLTEILTLVKKHSKDIEVIKSALASVAKVKARPQVLTNCDLSSAELLAIANDYSKDPVLLTAIIQHENFAQEHVNKLFNFLEIKDNTLFISLHQALTTSNEGRFSLYFAQKLQQASEQVITESGDNARLATKYTRLYTELLGNSLKKLPLDQLKVITEQFPYVTKIAAEYGLITPKQGINNAILLQTHNPVFIERTLEIKFYKMEFALNQKNSRMFFNDLDELCDLYQRSIARPDIREPIRGFLCANFHKLPVEYQIKFSAKDHALAQIYLLDNDAKHPLDSTCKVLQELAHTQQDPATNSRVSYHLAQKSLALGEDLEHDDTLESSSDDLSEITSDGKTPINDPMSEDDTNHWSDREDSLRDSPRP
ncbi:MAG: hypothetical protein K0S11_630 [Gammaproteobacteria bacterium]|jgi:hypothetical protein|nr:hypothetical protein [Gammaproteobacteria bacterium]